MEVVAEPLWNSLADFNMHANPHAHELLLSHAHARTPKFVVC